MIIVDLCIMGATSRSAFTQARSTFSYFYHHTQLISALSSWQSCKYFFLGGPGFDIFKVSPLLLLLLFEHSVPAKDRYSSTGKQNWGFNPMKWIVHLVQNPISFIRDSALLWPKQGLHQKISRTQGFFLIFQFADLNAFSRDRWKLFQLKNLQSLQDSRQWTLIMILLSRVSTNQLDMTIVNIIIKSQIISCGGVLEILQHFVKKKIIIIIIKNLLSVCCLVLLQLPLLCHG